MRKGATKKDIEMNGTKLKNYQKKVHQKIEIMFNFIYLINAFKNESGQKKLTKKFKSPSNLHEKSFINLSDLEKKYKRIPFKMNSL